MLHGKKEDYGRTLRTWSERGVQHVDVDADVDLGVPHAVLDFVDDALGADPVEIPRLDHVEAAPQVVAQVALGADQGGADPGVDRGVEDEVLFVGDVEEGAVV